MTESFAPSRSSAGESHGLIAPPSKVVLYGAQAHLLEAEIARHANLCLVDADPDVVVCYGGDGTLLSAEMHWPGLPKVPILNSRRGHRCIPHPPREVIAGLAEGRLVANVYTKLSSVVYRDGVPVTPAPLLALNEINVHMGRVNSAVRFQLWINDEPYEEGLEVLGDGLVVCTPFGSTAYFSKITHGIFSKGIGIAFKATTEPVNHLVLPGSVVVRVQITRGPAVLAVDSSHDYIDLDEGDEIVTRKHHHGATILTCGPVRRLDEPF